MVHYELAIILKVGNNVYIEITVTFIREYCGK